MLIALRRRASVDSPGKVTWYSPAAVRRTTNGSSRGLSTRAVLPSGRTSARTTTVEPDGGDVGGVVVGPPLVVGTEVVVDVLVVGVVVERVLVDGTLVVVGAVVVGPVDVVDPVVGPVVVVGSVVGDVLVVDGVVVVVGGVVVVG